MIKEIDIENYKSIQKLKLKLGRVTVLIGENGCGKSNILEAIALSAASAGNKLDNEFLVPRGIRATEPDLMRAAFDKNNITEEIKISLKGDNDFIFDCPLHNDNQPYTKWENSSIIDIFDISKSQVSESTMKIIAGLIILAGVIYKPTKNVASTVGIGLLINEIIQNHSKDSEILSENIDENFVTKKLEWLNENISHLQEFIIYSPEFHCLRNFKEEGQIQPLGINGEGLFKLLQVLSLDKDKLDELKEKLKLMGWFKDFQVLQNSSIDERAIQIQDRYLDEALTFDQRSTNEGFLFLLFYFSLFISDKTPPFFAIDNIDASLNPKLCRRLIKELVNLAKKYDKQVILTTHNPAILDGLNLNDDDQRLFIISRNRSGYTKALRFLKPETPEGEEPITLSEAFLRGYLGGLPKNF
jgi:AAA15 family ATPase/GTPase